MDLRDTASRTLVLTDRSKGKIRDPRPAQVVH